RRHTRSDRDWSSDVCSSDLNARNNGLLSNAAGKGFNPAYNATIAGSVPLPFFDSLPEGGRLNSSAFRTLILQNQIGNLAQSYQRSEERRVGKEGRSRVGRWY